jgi:sulfide:quinone oxidoreductase
MSFGKFATSKTLWRASLVSVPVVALGVTKVWLEAPTEDDGKHRIVIVGGGTAGVGIAAQLRHKGERDVVIIEPKNVHYYQPMWTLVGGNIKQNHQSAKPFASVLPRGVKHIADAAESFDPESNTVTTKSGKEIKYDYLVVATGIEQHFDRIEGLKETIGKNGVMSIYDYDLCQKTQEAIQNTKKGNLIFTQHADSPIKCGGAPQKIMWLTDDNARRKGFRNDVNIKWVLPQPSMFAVKKYGDILGRLAEEKGIERHFGMKLIKVDGDKKQATFQSVSDPKKKVVMDFALLHVIPYMMPPKAIRESRLVNSDGYVEVDKYTLQHKRYPNVFASGDSTNLPTSKTMAAIAKQAPILVNNLLKYDKKEPLNAAYDGYTSCPITIAKNRLLLAEFKYDGELAETFPFFGLQDEPRRVFMFFKETLFPFVYFNLYLPGYWYGPLTIFPPRFTNKGSASEDAKAVAASGAN